MADANARTSTAVDTATRSVLEKLDEDDRAVIEGALARAEKAQAELRYLAEHDPLTGLLDRRGFRSELDRHLALNARYGGQGAVMVIDIDGLKEVNDAFGHIAGDELIRRIARIMRERVRATDIAARLSGDEFAVLVPRADRDGALRLGESLRSRIAEEAAPVAAAAPVTISVGIAMFGSGRDPGAGAVLTAADQAMYRAKAEGRNRVSLFDEVRRKRVRVDRAPSVSARIRDALAHDRLSLCVQPIVSVRSGGVERYELLLRMVGDDGKLLPAASFIEAAERSGMVRELDRWVVARALELIASREKAGQPVSLHINLSGVSLSDLSVLEFIERRLDQGGADPARCTFELTATAAVPDFEAVAGFADRVSELGCQVAIDDYGAGFAPFCYLKLVPFDVIKIAGAFVRDMPRSDVDRLTVRAIVQLARGLRKTTIAEDVESDATIGLLREYGVDMAQGFHLGEPVEIAKALPA